MMTRPDILSRFRTVMFTVAVLFALTQTARAAGETNVLTRADCVSIGLQNNRELRNAMRDLDIAERKRRQALASYLPSLSYQDGFPQV